jgi:gluconokinase
MRTVIVMGVSGSGKTTIGSGLAERLGVPFYDADDFHSAHNRHKMEVLKQPLNDEDRRPWLENLASQIRVWNQRKGAVLACSALKQSYREKLAPAPVAVKWVYLQGTRDLLQQRLAARPEHFFPPALLENQLQTLEPPQDAFVVNIEETPTEIIDQIVQHLGTRP